MKKVLSFYIFALLFVACGGGDEPGSDEPIVSPDFIQVTPNLPLLGDGQETELMVTSNCRWTISFSAEWLSVTPTSGNNSGTLKVSAGKNTTGKERSATLTIQGGTAPSRSVVVTQAKGSEDPVTKALATNTTSLSFEAKEDTKSFTISSNTSWTISKPDWCSISATTGSGDAEIYVTTSENPNKEQRTGQIIVSGEGVSSVTISVSQKAKDTTGSEEPGADDNIPPT